jgi:integrase
MRVPGYLRITRHHVYCFRRRVPDDLLGRFASNELRCSLATKDKKEAVRRARVLALKIDLLFERLRTMANDKQEEADKQKEADPLQVDLSHEIDLRELGLGLHKIDYDPNKPGEKEEADRRIAQLTQLAGSASPAAPVAASGGETGRLARVIQDFFSPTEVGRRRDKASTVRKDRDALTIFQAAVGADTAPGQLSQRDAVRFAEVLENRGLAANTVNNHLGAVSKFSKWLQGRRPEFRHTRLDFSSLRHKVDKRADEQRQQFTVAEVAQILQDADLAAFRKRDPHKFWFPHIAAYSGMRVEEIAQLDPKTDIRPDEAGIQVFDINELNGKQLKNKTSRRIVPVHPVLLKLGLLDYVESVKKAGATRLFPDTKARDGRLGKNAAKTVNRFIRVNLGIPKTLHSFRHSVATQLKHKRVDEGITAALLGHAHGGITYTRYGKHYLAEVLLDEAIKKIAYGIPMESA